MTVYTPRDPNTPTTECKSIDKISTGVSGFDAISQGGLPKGRLTAVMGGPGTGKTLLALQILAYRSHSFREAGVFVTFEESIARVRANIESFAWGRAAAADDRLALIEARLPLDTTHSGAFDLNGLLTNLTSLKTETGATNIVFDSIDVLLGGIHDEHNEFRELARVNDWVRSEQMTAIMTVKQFGAGDRDQRRADYLSYLTDCVVQLNAELSATALSRTLRITKFRGSGFAGGLFPMVFTEAGIEVVAAQDCRVSYPTFSDRISTGVPRLDDLMDGGYVHGSATLVSGVPGTAKTSLAASFITTACAQGRRALFVSFDESDSQIVANMRSIGLDLQPHLQEGMLTMASLRSGSGSPEEHFLTIRTLIERHSPECLAIDPLSALLKTRYPFAVLITENLLDFVKSRGITVVCTSLLDQLADNRELTASHVSTIADTWLHVSYVAHNGERNRALTIVKSRGTGHSNQVRELILSSTGLDLVNVYAAEGAVLMGSARAQKEDALHQLHELNQNEFTLRRFALDRTVSDLESRSQIAAQELEWARRESDLLKQTEDVRLRHQRRAALERVKLRSKDTLGDLNIEEL